jgi:hypothetical protein
MDKTNEIFEPKTLEELQKKLEQIGLKIEKIVRNVKDLTKEKN